MKEICCQKKNIGNGKVQIKYGFLSALRAKGRTVLFALLILILTLTLTLGVGMWAYSAKMLDKMESQYTSIALIEYMGDDYPDADASDESARGAYAELDDQAISAIDGVQLWERRDEALGYINGYTKMFGTIPYSRHGVLVASNLSVYIKDEINVEYTGRVNKVLYTKNINDGTFIIYDFSSVDFEPEPGKKYLIHGQLSENGGSNKRFQIKPFYEGCEIQPWAELTDENEYLLTEGIFAEYADYYRRANNAVRITASEDIESLEIFQQGILYLEKGRFPTEGEKDVCVLSGTMAERMGVSTGSHIDISILMSDEDYIYDIKQAGEERSLKVVGITNVQNDYDGYIWIPAEEKPLSETFYGYELGRAVLENAKARQAADSISRIVPENVRVTLYDQGYSAAAQPIRAMESTSVTIMTISACGAAVVLFLFGYLFVGRQRESVQVMVSLGTPGGKIRTWLLSGSSLIAAFSSAIGACAGHLMLGSVIKTALSAARSLYDADTRYSEAVMGLIRETPEIKSVSVLYSVCAGLAIFFASVLLCLCFIYRARGENAPKRGRSVAHVPKGRTSTSGRGALRFALLSFKRGGWRSFVVPAAALVLTLFLCILASASRSWETQIDELYRSSVLDGQVVSTNGRSASNLSVSASSARKLWKSGALEDIYVSLGWNYWLPGEEPSFGNNAFGIEELNMWIKRQPELVALNDLSAAPEFYYTGKPEIEWLEGWDESFLSSSEYYQYSFFSGSAYFDYSPDNEYIIYGNDGFIDAYPIIAGRDFMKEHGFTVGDKFTVMTEINNYSHNSTLRLDVPLRIVGSFEQEAKKAYLYVPLSFWCDISWITGGREILAEGERVPLWPGEDAVEMEKYFYNQTTFRTCRFTLSSAYELEDLRDYLANEEYSQVGKYSRNRVTVLLHDQTFTETVSGLGRYVSFSRILFPVLFAVVGLLGFVISWLMMNGRRMEFAIMRGLGASGGRIFLSFFLEQAMLCLIGSIIGVLLIMVISIAAIESICLASAAFCACYLAGCALSVLVIGRTKLMTLLSERE